MHWTRLSLLGLLTLQLGCAIDDTTPEFNESGDRLDDIGEVNWQSLQERCSPPTEDEPVLYTNDYRWGYTLSELDERYAQLYDSPKRISKRARYNSDTDRFELPHVESWGGTVVLPKRFIENTQIHIEKALARGYAQGVFFPDMGHSHFFVPQDHWDAVYAGIPVPETSDKYTSLLDDPELRVLYHTAEQLATLDDNSELLPDPDLQWRYYTRNVVGDNRGAHTLDLLRNPESKANTSRSLENHHYIGAGFSLSANKNGCFPFVYEGETFFYDLSLFDAPLDPEAPGDDSGF